MYGRETYSNIKSYLTKHIDKFYKKTYSLLYYNTRILYILYRYSIRVSVRALSVRKLKFPRNLCEENSTLTNKYFRVTNRTVTRSELGALRFLDFGFFYEKFLQKEGKHKIKIILKKALKTDLKQIKKYKTINNSKFIEYPKKGFEELNWISKKIKKMGGGILLIDYGYHRHENKNTLQSIKSHKKNDVFDNVGQADITSLVNFGLLKNYFTQNKMKVNKIVSQSFFLKKLGILNRAEILANKMSFKDKSDLYLRLQRLLDARYMGELFKVIFAYKNKTKMPLGFI